MIYVNLMVICQVVISVGGLFLIDRFLQSCLERKSAELEDL